MLYKKISLTILPLAGLLLAGGCPNDNQAVILSISDHKDTLQNNKVEDHKLSLSLSSYRALGSISYMGGAIKKFLLQVKGSISDINSESEGQIAFIGLPTSDNEIKEFLDDLAKQVALGDDGAALRTKEPPIVKSAIHAKDQVEKFIWPDNDKFIYWNKVNQVGTGTKEWIIQVGEEVYKKLTSNKYAMHMLYAPSAASAQSYVVSTTPFQVDITGKEPSLPSYENIGLEAMPAIQKQTSNGAAWFLKGKIAGSCPADAKVGFLLIKDAVNPYNLVQQVIACKEGWPTVSTSFNDEMIVVPGKLRNIAPSIIAKLPSSQAPIQGDKYKMLCYHTQNEHYYLSQMEHILPDVSENSLSQESAPLLLYLPVVDMV